jgi:hypothetical protein
MQSANDTTNSSDSAARGYTDLETVRKRLIELEQNRIFSDEDLAMLLRGNVRTDLKGGIESRIMYRRNRDATSERTAGGRTVIRSWKPTVWVDDEADTDINAVTNTATNTDTDAETNFGSANETNSSNVSEDAGWKQFTPGPTARKVAKRPIVTPVRVEPAFIGRNLKRPSRLKRLQSRSFIVTILANIIFIPKQAVSSLVSLVVHESGRHAC